MAVNLEQELDDAKKRIAKLQTEVERERQVALISTTHERKLGAKCAELEGRIEKLEDVLEAAIEFSASRMDTHFTPEMRPYFIRLTAAIRGAAQGGRESD